MATARRTAAALGIIAFVYVGAAGVVQGSSAEWVLLRALIALVAFAAVGYAVGLVGAAVVRDAADGERKRREAEAGGEKELSTDRPAAADGKSDVI